MKVHRITVIVIDFDEVGAEEIKAILENTKYPNHCIAPAVVAIESRDIGEWSDDHPLNRTDTYQSTLDALFSTQATPPEVQP